MPTVKVEIEVWCECGEGLCKQSHENTRHRGTGIIVEPCQKCLQAKYDEGRDDGYREASDEG